MRLRASRRWRRRHGATKKGSRRLADQLAAVLTALDVLPLEPPVDIT